jgi:hypothetical protein
MSPRVWVLVAFLLITVLTALAVLGASLGFFPEANERLVTWGMPVVLGEIVATVVIFFRTQWSTQIKINLAFENAETNDIRLDSSNCRYEIYEGEGRKVRSGNLTPNFGVGGWQIELPADLRPDQVVYLQLQALTGETWEVRPFLPFVHTRSADKSIQEGV